MITIGSIHPTARTNIIAARERRGTISLKRSQADLCSPGNPPSREPHAPFRVFTLSRPDLIKRRNDATLGAESSQTRCGAMHSKFRSAMPRHRHQGWHLHSTVSGGSSSRRNSSIGSPSLTTVRMIPPRRRSIGLNSAEASKLLLISRGTGWWRRGHEGGHGFGKV